MCLFQFLQIFVIETNDYFRGMHISYFGRLTKVHKFLSQSNQIRVIQFLELWISWIWDAQSSLCTHLANTKLNASKCGFIETFFSDWAPAMYLQLLLVIAFCECVCGMHACAVAELCFKCYLLRYNLLFVFQPKLLQIDKLFIFSLVM